MLQRDQIHAVALAHRVEPRALEAITTMVQAHFGDRTPPPAELEAYIHGLPTWEKVAMSYAEFNAMPPAWRLEQGQKYQAPVDRRATGRIWTAEELKALEGKSVHDWLTAGHTGPPQTGG